MDPIQSPDHHRMRAAHEAPRCEHIRMNGRRCGSPALRGESHCYFLNIPTRLFASPLSAYHLPLTTFHLSVECYTRPANSQRRLACRS